MKMKNNLMKMKDYDEDYESKDENKAYDQD